MLPSHQRQSDSNFTPRLLRRSVHPRELNERSRHLGGRDADPPSPKPPASLQESSSPPANSFPISIGYILLDSPGMPNVTQLLDSAAAGDPRASADLLPLVYDELRKLAAARIAEEKPGQTLQATALVHEAFVRLVGCDPGQPWNSRGHFFAAAAEAMRRILIENARRKQADVHGGGRPRVDLPEDFAAPDARPDELLALDAALTRLERHDEQAARLVKLRYFAGLSMPEAAVALGLSLRTAERNWTYARTWLHRELARSS